MIAIAHDLPLRSARQVQVSCKRLARIERAVPRVAFSIKPTCIVTGVWGAVWLARVTRTTTESSRVIVIATVRANVGRPRVGVAIGPVVIGVAGVARVEAGVVPGLGARGVQ